MGSSPLSGRQLPLSSLSDKLDNKKVKHTPQKNDLLIFNSSVHHSVNPYFGKNDRIAIAWDAIYTF